MSGWVRLRTARRNLLELRDDAALAAQYVTETNRNKLGTGGLRDRSGFRHALGDAHDIGRADRFVEEIMTNVSTPYPPPWWPE